jgi:uncharacterized protein (TIGR02118 family)
MITYLALLKRRPELGVSEFRRYFLDEHVALARQLPGLREYRVHVAEDDQGDGPYDAVAEHVFDDRGAAERAFASPQNAPALADVTAHTAKVDYLLVQDTPVLVSPAAAPATATDWARRYFATADRMDPGAITDHFAADARFVFANALPVTGRNAIRAALASFFATVDTMRHELTGVWVGRWERGPVVSVEADVHYRGRGGGTIPPLPCTSTIRLIDEGDRWLVQDYRIFMDLAPLNASPHAPDATRHPVAVDAAAAPR